MTAFIKALEAFGLVGDVMTKYWKNGFWRTSALGNEHWVEGHWVGRDNWDRSSEGNGGSDRATSSDCINVPARKVTFPDEKRGAKTYLTPCWWCQETVFYHSNGNGDSVLFDSLGWPWEVHSCWTDYSKSKKTISDIPYTSEIRYHPPKPSLYFNQIIDSYIENPSPKVPEDNHALLLGLAQMIATARVGSYSIFGFSETKLSECINLPIEELRQSYGRFYTRYKDSELSIKTISFAKIFNEIETKNIAEKYQLIISAIKEMKEVTKGGFGFYLTEDLLAKSMGLSLQELKLQFGQIYTVYVSGKIYLPAEPPKQIQKPLPVLKKMSNQNMDSAKKLERNKDKILEIRRNNITKKTNGSQ